jgi:hypothetical protein
MGLVGRAFDGASGAEAPAPLDNGFGTPGGGPLAALERALNDRAVKRERDSFRLLLRVGLLNLIGLALFGVAYSQGWVQEIITADTSGISIMIGVAFLLGLGLAIYRAVRISHELNQVRRYDPLVPSRVRHYLEAIRARNGGSRAISADALKLRMADRLGTIRHIASGLVLLGLIGTVLGFIESLAGVSAESAGSAEAISPMISALVQGMSVALYTTLVGSVLNLWLTANYRLLVSGTVSLVTALIDLGERHARD